MVEIKQPSGPKPKQDYSELTQKPITLKKGIGGLVRPGERKRQPADAESTASVVSVQKKKTLSRKPHTTTTVQWTLRGVSATAKEVAVNAAREEGLKLNEWLERAIYQAVSASPEHREPDQPLQDALDDIRVRLERIELQSGFFYRIWERLKELAAKPA